MVKYEITKATCGMMEDWFWTAGDVTLKDGEVKFDEWVWPSSIWATPSLCITTDDGEVIIPVWKFEKEGVEK